MYKLSYHPKIVPQKWKTIIPHGKWTNKFKKKKNQTITVILHSPTTHLASGNMMTRTRAPCHDPFQEWAGTWVHGFRAIVAAHDQGPLVWHPPECLPECIINTLRMDSYWFLSMFFVLGGCRDHVYSMIAFSQASCSLVSLIFLQWKNGGIASHYLN